MSPSEIRIMAGQQRMTTPAFNVKTRVVPHRAPNPFYRKENAKPSPVVVIRPS